MKDLLMEQLKEYKHKFDANQNECIELMKKGEPWQEHAKKGAGLKMMIEATLFELKKYIKEEPK
jgi:hypothetical protein